MAGFQNDVVFAANVDFSGSSPASGEINLNGEILVGATTAPFIRPYVPTGTNGLVINKGPGTLDFTLSSIPNNAIATPFVTITSGTGLSGGGLVNLGGSVTLNLSTPVTVANGGTGDSTFTNNSALLASGTTNTGAFQNIASVATGQVLISQGTSTLPAYSNTLPSTVQGNITTVGTVTSGTWNGSVIDPAHGGTGIANNNSSTLTISGNFGTTLTVTGTTGVTLPTSGTLATTSQLLTTPVSVGNGGTGRSTLTNHGVLVGATTSAITQLAAGSAGQVLQSGGGSADPAYSTPTYPAASGTSRKILVSDGTNNVYSTETWATPGSSGNILTSDGTNWNSSAPLSGLLTYTTTTLTNSQIKNLNGTPVQFIAAPGSGKVLVPVSVVGKLIYGGSNVFTAAASQSVALYWGTTTSSGAVLSNASIVRAASNYGLNAFLAGVNNVVIANVENVALNLWNPVATEISGNAANNNTMSFSLLYYVISI